MLTKTNIKKVAVTLLMTLVLMMSTVMSVGAQDGFGITGASPAAVTSSTGGQGSLRQLALTIVNFALTFLGLIAVIMIIYGGFLYVTAAGKEDKVETGKKIIMYSIMGIVIILLSFAIVNTVLTAGTGATTG